MKREAKITIVGVVMVTAFFMVTYLVPDQDTSLSHLQQNGTIRIGYAIEAPYAFIKPGGEVTGESPEIAKVIVARLGIKQIEWRQIEFGNLIPELVAGHIDVIAAGMFITAERANQVNFSEPTFHVRLGLLVAKGNPKNIHSYDQAQATEAIKIAVLSGSVEERLLKQIVLQEQQLVVVPDALTGQVTVETGLADALALSSPTIQWMVLQKKVGDVEIVDPLEQTETDSLGRSGYGAFAFRKTDRQLLSHWNMALTAYLGSKEHLELISRFGFNQAELPVGITTQEIITP